MKAERSKHTVVLLVVLRRTQGMTKGGVGPVMDPIPMEIKSSQEAPNFERSSRVYYDERPNQPGPNTVGELRSRITCMAYP
jgi:hypothetical protein